VELLVGVEDDRQPVAALRPALPIRRHVQHRVGLELAHQGPGLLERGRAGRYRRCARGLDRDGEPARSGRMILVDEGERQLDVIPCAKIAQVSAIISAGTS